MVIQHNMAAIFSQREFNKNNGRLSKSLEKLSSGYAVNRAGDNAAGLAVSEKMRSQIFGIKQSVKNCSDGVSLIQTFEGALGETVAIIRRARDLAAQSANGTYQDDVDREAIQIEYMQLCDEVNQLADTDFNGICMLNDGRMADTFTGVTEEGVYWIPPENICWDKDSYQNKTNSPEVEMKISLLPGMKSLVVDEPEEFEALAQLDKAQVSAYIKKGVPEYYFTGDSIPANHSIRTEENIGIISFHSPDGKVTDVAQVTLPEFTHNASSTATGKWVQSGIGSVSYTIPAGISSSPSTAAERQAYLDWVKSIPTVTATVNNDTDTYTSGGVVYSEDSDILPLASTPPTTVSVSYNEASVKPGGTVRTGYYSCYGSVGTVRVTDADGKNANVSMGSVSQAQAEADWLANGKTTRRYTYSQTGNCWKDNDGNTVDLNNIFNLSTSSLESKLANGYTIADGTSFMVSISGPRPTSSSSGMTFSTGSSNAEFTMGEYDPEHPELGGIDYRIADDKAVYTYVNSEYNSSDPASSGYWVDENNRAVNLASVGVHLPTNRSTASDILHSGMKIKVSNPLAGATGTIKGDIQLWDSQTDAFRVAYQNLTYSSDLTLQSGARTKDSVKFTFAYSTEGLGGLEADLNCTTRGLGMDKLSLATQEEANYAIDKLDNAVNKVSMIRSSFGAAQNRLEHKIDNLNTSAENLTASESRIRDTDMAKEMVNFTKEQILSQSAQAMLSQANSLPQGVLSLISG